MYMHQIAYQKIGVSLVSCLFMAESKAAAQQEPSLLQGGLATQPSGNSWGQPGSPGSRPGTAGSYRGTEASPSASKLAALQQTSFNKANSGALSEASSAAECNMNVCDVRHLIMNLYTTLLC